MFVKTKVPQKNPSTGDCFFENQSRDEWKSMEDKTWQMSLFKETQRYVERGDGDAAIRSLTNIINLPGLESWQYEQAYHFLNKLFAFSERYFDLYGVQFEIRN